MSEHRPPFDPGWNDPPTFNYSNAPPPTKTKLNLNKRIAFPIQSSAQTTTDLPKVEISAAGLPMPFARVKLSAAESQTTPVLSSNVPIQPPPPPSMTTNNAPRQCKSNEESISYVECEANALGNSFEQAMNIFRDITQSLASTEKSKVEEIEKRFQVLETMWSEGKIDDKLICLLVNTAKALKDNQFSAAIDLQRSMTVDHGSSICSQWGPALRQLIILQESMLKPTVQNISDVPNSDEPKFMNPLDDHETYGSSSTVVGRVKHL